MVIVLIINRCSQTTSEHWLFLPVTTKLCVCLIFWLCMWWKAILFSLSFLDSWDFKQDWVWEWPWASFPKIFKAWIQIYIYIRLEIYKNKKKKEPNCVFLLAAGAEIAAKFSSSPAENWYSLFFLHIFHGVDNDVFVYCDWWEIIRQEKSTELPVLFFQSRQNVWIYYKKKVCKWTSCN